MRNILIVVLLSSFAVIGPIHSTETETEKLTHHDEHDNDVPKVPVESHQLEMTTVKTMRNALLKATGSFALKADRTKPMEKFVDNLPKRPLRTLKDVRAKLNVPGLLIKKQEILEPKRGNFANFVDGNLPDETPEIDDMDADISDILGSSEEESDDDRNHDIWEVRKNEWILCQVVSKSNSKHSPFCKNCYVCRNVIKLNKELNVRSSSAEVNDDDHDHDGNDEDAGTIATAANDDMQARRPMRKRPGRRPGAHPRPHIAPRPKPRPAVASVASILHKKKPLESPLKPKLIHPTAILPPLSLTHQLSKKDSQSNLIEKVQKDRESETMTILKRAYNEKRISLKEYLTILNNLVYLSNKPLLRVHGTMIPHDFRVLTTGQRSANSETTVEPETVDTTTSLPLPATTTVQPIVDKISES